MTHPIQDNPLLDFSNLPLFDRISPAHVAPAVDTLLADSSAALDTVTHADFPARWSDIAKVLDVSTEKLGRAWGAVSHLNSVADTPELRAAYNAALPKVTEFFTRLGADERLYAKYKAIDVATLNTEQRQAHKNAVRNFVLGGAELVGAARERFAAIQEKQAELSQKFSENALDATDAYAYYATLDELAGVPADVVQTALAAAKSESKDGYKLTLKMPCYLPVMQFAKSGALREKLYRAYVTRASDQAAPDALKFDNSVLIGEILALRLEESQLLGYGNFGELSLVPKMADSPAQVIAFLRDLGSKARPFAEKDLSDLREFASTHLNLNDPQSWDWPYIGEKLKEARYAFSEQEIKEYFTAPKVLAGLFKIIETLYNVTLHRDDAPVWHPSVEFYRIERRGDVLGHFYLDLFARTGKRGGGWMNGFKSRWHRPEMDMAETPLCVLVLDWPESGSLTHNNVVDLFHEFGHGLHHLLTRVDEHEVSGINGVEWDAVELPSQFMENFAWEWDVLKRMTEHPATGKPLPLPIFQRMIAAKNFQSGMQMLRQVEYSLIDMRLHVEADAGNRLTSIVTEVRASVAIVENPAWSRTLNTFGHIFSGAYGAGYYSYLWAEVLSSDAYYVHQQSIFEDPNDATAEKFRTCILEVGGVSPSSFNIQNYLGRAPSSDALLAARGLAPWG